MDFPCQRIWSYLLLYGYLLSHFGCQNKQVYRYVVKYASELPLLTALTFPSTVVKDLLLTYHFVVPPSLLFRGISSINFIEKGDMVCAIINYLRGKNSEKLPVEFGTGFTKDKLKKSNLIWQREHISIVCSKEKKELPLSVYVGTIVSSPHLSNPPPIFPTKNIPNIKKSEAASDSLDVVLPRFCGQ